MVTLRLCRIGKPSDHRCLLEDCVSEITAADPPSAAAFAQLKRFVSPKIIAGVGRPSQPRRPVSACWRRILSGRTDTGNAAGFTDSRASYNKTGCGARNTRSCDWWKALSRDWSRRRLPFEGKGHTFESCRRTNFLCFTTMYPPPNLIAHVIFSFVRGYLARDFRAHGASWPDFDQKPPGSACTDALDPKSPHSTKSRSGMPRWSP
jgi:hypothetical protein